MRLQKPRCASGGACPRPSLSDDFGGENRSDDSDRTRRNYSYRHYRFVHRYIDTICFSLVHEQTLYHLNVNMLKL